MARWGSIDRVTSVASNENNICVKVRHYAHPRANRETITKRPLEAHEELFHYSLSSGLYVRMSLSAVSRVHPSPFISSVLVEQSTAEAMRNTEHSAHVAQYKVDFPVCCAVEGLLTLACLLSPGVQRPSLPPNGIIEKSH